MSASDPTGEGLRPTGPPPPTLDTSRKSGLSSGRSDHLAADGRLQGPLLGFGELASAAHRTQRNTALAGPPAYCERVDGTQNGRMGERQRATRVGRLKSFRALSVPTTGPPSTSVCPPTWNAPQTCPSGFLWRSHHIDMIDSSLATGK